MLLKAERAANQPALCFYVSAIASVTSITGCAPAHSLSPRPKCGSAGTELGSLGVTFAEGSNPVLA